MNNLQEDINYINQCVREIKNEIRCTHDALMKKELNTLLDYYENRKNLAEIRLNKGKTA